MERIRLDIIPKGLMPVCHASQYDDGRVIRLDLMDGLQGYSLTDEEIELDVRKPDGHIVTASVDVVAGNTFVDIVTTEQMCAVEGENICELKISKDGAEIYSLNFRMMVEKSVLEGGDPSESFIHNLNQQIYDAVAEQYTGEVIFDAVPTENHGTGYAVTSEGVKNAISEAVPDALNDLSDVDIDNPTSNQALVFNPVTQKWENGEVSTVGGLNDLNDVTIDDTSLEDKQELVFNEDEGVFENKTTRVELTQAEYNQLVADDEVLPDVDYYITDAPSMQGTSADLSYDGTTKSVYTKIGEVESDISDLSAEVDTKADSSDIPTVTDLSSSVTVGSMFNTPDYKKCYKYGKVCHLVMRAKLNSALSDNTAFVTLPSTVAPKGNDYAQIIWTGTQYATNTPKNAYFGSWDNSLHNLGGVTSGTYIAIDAVWITNA